MTIFHVLGFIYCETKISIYKDCKTNCDTDGCNDDKDVELLFSKLDENGEPESIQCFAYRSDLNTEYDYSAMSLNSRNTNFTIQENEVSDRSADDYQDSDDYLMDCPRFANQGCFKAEYTQGTADLPTFVSGFHKGCSMYPLGDISKECTTAGAIGTTCRGMTLFFMTHNL